MNLQSFFILHPLNDLHEVSGMLSERIESWEQQWEKRGIEKGLQFERHALLRLVRKHFGTEVVEQSTSLVQRIDDPQSLEDLFEQLLDSVDGEAWLRTLKKV